MLGNIGRRLPVARQVYGQAIQEPSPTMGPAECRNVHKTPDIRPIASGNGFSSGCRTVPQVFHGPRVGSCRNRNLRRHPLLGRRRTHEIGIPAAVSVSRLVSSIAFRHQLARHGVSSAVDSKFAWIYNGIGISFMQVSKWGNSLAVRLPAVVVEALDLKEGDEIEISIAGNATSRWPVTGPKRGRSISFVK